MAVAAAAGAAAVAVRAVAQAPAFALVMEDLIRIILFEEDALIPAKAGI